MIPPTRVRRPSAFADFLRSEAAGGGALLLAAALAMVVANSALAPDYFALLHAHLGPLSVLHWVNDGLMALFFLLVGLEIKREALAGALRAPADRVLPGIAAACGMAVPALIYLAVTRAHSELHRGWAIPAATDIAFALGVLALLGRRAPVAVKVQLTAIAVLDDLGAILIIALAYTAGLNVAALAGALGLLALLLALNRRGARALWPYLAIGTGVWALTYASGVHATLAGVAVALCVPFNTSRADALSDEQQPLARLEHALSPVVAFGIVPLFGFANAGVDLSRIGWHDLAAPLPLGIAVALFAGKQLGVFGAVAGVGRPRALSWRHVHGLSALCGIGFTMSLFIAALAFGEGSKFDDLAKLGVLTGSFASAALAGVIFLAARSRP